jgi:hypothetical protein
MNRERIVIGAAAFFFPAGNAFTVPSAGTASRTAKPGAADTGWINLGEADWTLTPDNKSTPFYARSSGKQMLYDKITTQVGLKLKGKLMEMQNLSFQMLLGTLALPVSPTAGGQFNPGEGDPIVRGWLQLQQRNAAQALVCTYDLFVAMNIPGDVKFEEGPVDIDVEAELLASTLNTGSLV